MANTKISAKSSKAEFIDFIRGVNLKSIKDKGLVERLSYTLKALDKDEAKVTKSDLFDTVKELLAYAKATPAKAPVEASTKPLLKKGKAPKTEEKVTETEAPKEGAKKAPAKQEKKEKPKVETAEDIAKSSLPMAKLFPATLEHESLGKLVACYDKYSTVDEIREALEQGKELIFATYWTKRHIKQFAYGLQFNVPTPKAGFPYDLDMLQVLYACESIDKVYALSAYTEAMLTFLEEDLKRVDVESNDGETYSMRYAAGLEFEIYEVSEEAEAQPEEAPAPAKKKGKK